MEVHRNSTKRTGSHWAPRDTNSAATKSRAYRVEYNTTPLAPVFDSLVDEMSHPSKDDGEPKLSVLSNTRLTSLVGLILFIELLAIGITVPAIGQLFTLHAVVGYLLIPPLALKVASTSYRFVQYYLRNPRYYRAGPPHPLLRIAAPLLVGTTVVLMLSGVMLMIVGPYSTSAQMWRTLHQASFVAWFVVAAMHIVVYFPKAVYQGGGELGLRRFGMLRFSSARPSAALLRIGVALAFALAGVLVAAWGYRYIGPWHQVLT